MSTCHTDIVLFMSMLVNYHLDCFFISYFLHQPSDADTYAEGTYGQFCVEGSK